ncbi:V-set domain-containing T-cell activation inhibitor 1-like isoform X3 [Salvelinus fontinalis]|uniref:V-set domain-containing T-cell activation inhibitor 1-like isoform X3 n=1 Tax=Salvelinus fontinalis TaxID=8038 RepID=UPI002485F9A4|nr:V-set domain-containing T-cell activation inhibitor 1-like isoform X3 [Salvelinus fontinalis]
MKTFPTAAAWCFGILFISVSLTTTGSSEVQVVGSAGDDIILPCSLKPSVSAEDMTVQWTRLNLKAEKVHLYLDGRVSNEDQFPSYKGKTSMFHEELKNGNVSLKLTRVTCSDAGRYRCFIPTPRQETTVQLIVGAVSQPVISVLSCICVDAVSQPVISVLSCICVGAVSQPVISVLSCICVGDVSQPVISVLSCICVGAVSQPVISVLSCFCRCCISASDLCFILFL